MDFRRIDKNTVQCILTEEEMHAYGFEIEDLFSDQKKSRDFLEQIVERAEEEVGYQSKGGMISMQIMKMPNNDLAITFSEKNHEEGFLNVLQQLHQLAGLLDPELAGQLHNEKDTADLDDLSTQEAQLADSDGTQPMKELERRKERKISNSPKLFRFASLHDLEQFVAAIELQKPITSTVYKDENDNSYYLLLKKGRLKREEYELLCQRISEFAVLVSEQTYVEQFCKEHFTMFVPRQAIRILKNIETGI